VLIVEPINVLITPFRSGELDRMFVHRLNSLLHIPQIIFLEELQHLLVGELAQLDEAVIEDLECEADKYSLFQVEQLFIEFNLNFTRPLGNEDS